MNINKALDKAFENVPIQEMPDLHVSALQGVSDRMAKLLEEAFHITTIRDLANLKYAQWAQAIVDLAPTDTSDAVAREQAVAQREADAAAAQAAAAQAAAAQTSTSKPASTKGTVPAVWRFNTGRSSFGIYVNAEGCWMGNQSGQVFQLDHDAKVLKQLQLPRGVMCLVGDGRWVYAGCDDGNVYDLTGDAPVVAYAIQKSVDIYWLDIFDGNLGVGDSKGMVAAFDFEQQPLFKVKSGGTSVWMVRCDSDAVYIGNSAGVSALDWATGKDKWHRRLPRSVLFGWQEATTLYAASSDNKVHQFAKDGTEGKSYACDGSVYSCAAAEDGKYVFAGDNSGFIYCFNKAGERLWKLKTGAASAFSMQYFRDHLYVVTSSGAFICIDVSEEAIKQAKSGQARKARAVAAPTSAGRAPVQEVARTTSVGSGVVVECYFEGSRLRVRPVSAGYKHTYHVQFPRGLREDGVKFVVDELVECGNFYRARGNIRRLDE